MSSTLTKALNTPEIFDLMDLHVLHHDVLVRHQAVDAVVAPLPPVFGSPLVEQQRGALLEGQLAGRATHVVELGDGFNGLALCRDTPRESR